MSRPTAKVRRPRYRPHRRRSRRFAAFLDKMVEKWDGEQADVAVDTVDNDVLSLGSDPLGRGPFVLVGAPPPELRADARFWLTYDSGDATIYSSLAAMRDDNPKTLEAWDLAPAWASLTASTMVLASATDVANATETFTKTAHGYLSGAGPFRATTSDTLPAGLVVDTDYYLIKVTSSTFKLSDTKAHAIAGTNIVAIADDGTGNQTLTLAGVDVTANTFALAAHGMVTGDGPIRLATTGTLPTGLLAATDYYAIAIDANTLAVATSRANAIAGTAVNITGIGSGSHTLPRALTVKKDLSAEGIEHWLGQGLKPEKLLTDDVADVETTFA